MKNKVLILGAGIGAMTIGFENAGCSVDGAYEKDKRAIGLCIYKMIYSFASIVIGMTAGFQNVIKANHIGLDISIWICDRVTHTGLST